MYCKTKILMMDGLTLTLVQMQKQNVKSVNHILSARSYGAMLIINYSQRWACSCN